MNVHTTNYDNEVNKFIQTYKSILLLRVALDRGLVLIWWGADREDVVTLKALFVALKNSAYT